MYKEIIICSTIIFFVVILNIITMNYTQNVVEVICSDLNDLKNDLLEEKEENKVIKNNYKEVMDKWKEKYEVLAYYIEHDELEKVETELTALEASIDVDEYEDGIENLDRCIFILNHIKDKYCLDIKNIF